MDSKLAQFAFDLLKLAPRYLVALTIITAFLLFSPEPLIKKLGLDQLTEDYRPWIGTVFLITSVLFIVDRCIPVMAWVRELHAARQARNEQRKKLETLTEDEKKILRFYIFNETKTNNLEIFDGVVNGLVSAGIIRQMHEIGAEYRFAYNISEFPWQHLHEDRSLLDGDTDAVRTDEPPDDDDWQS